MLRVASRLAPRVRSRVSLRSPAAPSAAPETCNRTGFERGPGVRAFLSWGWSSALAFVVWLLTVLDFYLLRSCGSPAFLSELDTLLLSGSFVSKSLGLSLRKLASVSVDPPRSLAAVWRLARSAVLLKFPLSPCVFLSLFSFSLPLSSSLFPSSLSLSYPLSLSSLSQLSTTSSSSSRSISSTPPVSAWYNPWGRDNALPPESAATPDPMLNIDATGGASVTSAYPDIPNDSLLPTETFSSAASSSAASSSSASPLSDFTADEILSTLDPSLLDATTVLTRAQEIVAIQPMMDELTYFPPSVMIRILEQTWEYAQCPWYQAIIVTTLGFRFAMTPLMIRSMRNNSRMAHMKPDMELLNAAFQANPNKDTMEEQQKHRGRLQALFKKFECNPLHSIVMIFAQMPVFMGMFFGIRSMAEGGLCPSFAYQGLDLTEFMGSYGDFTDLTVPDASFLLPVYTAATFLFMVELGADGMDPQQGNMMKNVMRGLAVCMIPFSMNIPQGVFMYWCTNNTWSLAQSAVLKNKSIKSSLGIWEAPKAASGGLAGSADLMKMWNSTLDKIQGVSEQEQAANKAKEAIPQAVFNSKPARKKVGGAGGGGGGGGGKKGGKRQK